MRTFCILLFIAVTPLLSLGTDDGPKEPEKKKVSELVKQLGAKEYQARQDAEEQLKSLPDSVVPQLKKELKKAQDPEVKMRLKQIVDKLTPVVTVEKLKALQIPEIDFRSANIHDCFTFLEEIGGKTFTIKTELGESVSPPLVTFSAKFISVYEALNIITDVTNLKFSLEKGVIVVRPK